MPVSASYRPAPVHPALGDGFFDRGDTRALPAATCCAIATSAGRSGSGSASSRRAEWEDHFARFVPLPGNLPQPLALRYHGHQFRVYNAALGDGRGFLFAQLRDVHDGRLLDLATKGSGQTPWSRGGDGRLTLKGGVREVLATAMLEALGVPTSKSFSLFETGERLERGDEPSPTRSSVLVRLGHSHVRFGTFQRLRYHDDEAALRRLVEFSVEHYLPEAAGADEPARGVPARGDGAQRTPLRRVDGGGLRARRAQHRQHERHGRELRLRAVSLPARPRPRLRRRLLRPGGSLRVRPPAGDRAVEPGAPRRRAHAARARSRSLARALAAYDSVFHDAFHGAVLTRLGLWPRRSRRGRRLVARGARVPRREPHGLRSLLLRLVRRRRQRRAGAGEPGGARTIAGARFAALRRRLEQYAPRHPERLALPYFQRAAPCTLLIDDIEALWAAIAERDDWAPFDAKLEAIEELRSVSDPLV